MSDRLNAPYDFEEFERRAVRAAAGHRSRFEHGDRNAACGEGHRGRHAGVAGTHDGYAAIHVFHASQNFRSGVSEVRCLSTR